MVTSIVNCRRNAPAWYSALAPMGGASQGPISSSYHKIHVLDSKCVTDLGLLNRRREGLSRLKPLRGGGKSDATPGTSTTINRIHIDMKLAAYDGLPCRSHCEPLLLHTIGE